MCVRFNRVKKYSERHVSLAINAISWRQQRDYSLLRRFLIKNRATKRGRASKNDKGVYAVYVWIHFKEKKK
ncbi:DUF2087 domain-containing protein [Pantoea sp. Marseille-Q5743]|uniref:DUF2087 domain-containing protein n=1 Tax=Pantoea sp. Marseille-Q5743 TaxID=2972776 RepID=UPI00396768B7